MVSGPQDMKIKKECNLVGVWGIMAKEQRYFTKTVKATHWMLQEHRREAQKCAREGVRGGREELRKAAWRR